MPTSRERIFAALRHETLDRIPICEDAIWPETLARWRTEGLPPEADPYDYFGLDRIVRSVAIDSSFFPHEIYEDNAEYCVDLNGEGTVVKWYKNRGSSAGHQELDHRVKTLDDWRAARGRLDIHPRRLRPAPRAIGDCFSVMAATDHYWMSFRMFGLEELCCRLIETPDEMREIYSDYTDFLLGMFDLALVRGPAFDAIWFFADMAYHSGPLFSIPTFRDVVAPGFHRVKTWCREHGKWFWLHSDGNLSLLFPELLDVGFDLIHPLEARAGNDVRTLKAAYGSRVTLMGNINADILAAGQPAAIEEEIATKIGVAKQGGGYLYNIDHSVPPTVSLASYRHALACIRRHGRYPA